MANTHHSTMQAAATAAAPLRPPCQTALWRKEGGMRFHPCHDSANAPQPMKALLVLLLLLRCSVCFLEELCSNIKEVSSCANA